MWPTGIKQHYVKQGVPDLWTRASSSSSAFPAISLVFTILGETFVYVTVLYSNHRGSHIPSSWMVHAGSVSVASIHPRTWMSWSFECMQWNACVKRQDLSLYSHLKEFLRNAARTNVNSKGKSPSTGGSEESWTCKASHRTVSPAYYQLSYFSPQESAQLKDSFCLLVQKGVSILIRLFTEGFSSSFYTLRE